MRAAERQAWHEPPARLHDTRAALHTPAPQVALKCPPFLQAWAARWMPQAAAAPGGEPPVLRLLVVAGYRAQPGPLRAATVHNLGLPTITSAPAASTVYIPCA